jgi:TatD DNase family protein
MLVDSHAHLYWDSYQEDFNDVIQRAKDNDIKLIINIGVDLETSKKCLELSADGIQLYFTIGIHPHDGNNNLNDESIHRLIEDLERLYGDQPDKIVAIGECGLDYYSRDSAPSSIDKELQMKLYKVQVELAKKLGLPLVIHCRDAWEHIFIPELSGTTGVFHNFSGSIDDVKKALELGYYLSISCVATYPKNEPLRLLLKDIPLDRILTETDCPFLPPQQIRGQRNEPSYIPEVVKVIAEAKGISFEEAATQILKNTLTLFKTVSIGI